MPVLSYACGMIRSHQYSTKHNIRKQTAIIKGEHEEEREMLTIPFLHQAASRLHTWRPVYSTPPTLSFRRVREEIEADISPGISCATCSHQNSLRRWRIYIISKKKKRKKKKKKKKGGRREGGKSRKQEQEMRYSVDHVMHTMPSREIPMYLFCLGINTRSKLP